MNVKQSQNFKGAGGEEPPPVLADVAAGAREAKPAWRARVASVVRLGVCLLAVAWLYKTTNWHDVRQVVAGADWKLALLGLVAFGPAPVLISLRLKWLLAVHDIHLSLWQTVKITFVGSFVIQMLPVGTSGGDAIKAWYVARETPRKHEAIIGVLFDRVIGVVGLLLLSGVMVLINWGNPAMASWGKAAAARPWMNLLGPKRLIGLLVLGLVVCGGLYFSLWFRRVLRLEQLIARLPLAGHLHRLDQAVFEFRKRKGRLVACLVLAMFLQVWSILSTFLGGWALGLAPHGWHDFPVYLAYIPICFLCGALPLGIMEVVYVQLFASAAALGSPEAALSLSLVSRLFQLAWGLPGGLALLTGRLARPTSVALKDDKPRGQGPQGFNVPVADSDPGS
jgi:glycosyltransferase 2 family protein